MNQSIGETITAFRKQNKMSQKDLADALKEYGIYVKNATWIYRLKSALFSVF